MIRDISYKKDVQRSKQKGTVTYLRSDQKRDILSSFPQIDVSIRVR